MQSFTDGFSQALAGGFGKEGFKKLADTMKQGFKSVLVAFIDGVEKLMIGADIFTLIASMIPGMQVQAITNAGLKLAGLVALETLKSAVMAMATGGMVTKPTLVMAGEAGDEIYAPKKDFITIAREIIAKERLQNIPAIQQAQQKVIFEVRSGEFQVKGRDLISNVNINQIYEQKRFAY
jgi:hypothetical protein